MAIMPTIKFLSYFRRAYTFSNSLNSFMSGNVLRTCNFYVAGNSHNRLLHKQIQQTNHRVLDPHRDFTNFIYFNYVRSIRISCFSQNVPKKEVSNTKFDDQNYESKEKTRDANVPNEKLDVDTKIETQEPKAEKLGLFQRYKKMMKEYWYILIPVHIVTSTIWFGSFYCVAKSGFDFMVLLEMLNLPDFLLAPLRNSSLGYIAVASALYKLATPARYMVTLGGSTVSIKILTKRGLIKPVPTKEKLKTMIQTKLKQNKKNSD